MAMFSVRLELEKENGFECGDGAIESLRNALWTLDFK
jgi:hypothetical protein